MSQRDGQPLCHLLRLIEKECSGGDDVEEYHCCDEDDCQYFGSCVEALSLLLVVFHGLLFLGL